MPDRVYPVCYYNGAAIGASSLAGFAKRCGTFHTMTPGLAFTGNIDRNMGFYLSSASWTAAAGGNKYNVTLYGSL